MNLQVLLPYITITIDGLNTVHTFTSSGTFTVVNYKANALFFSQV